MSVDDFRSKMYNKSRCRIYEALRGPEVSDMVERLDGQVVSKKVSAASEG
jgi:hypothetical protein